jgi:alanine dehydrogenase
MMKIGVPKEVKTEEYRVSMTPHGVAELVLLGHEVLVQSLAGEGSGYTDELYVQAGAILLDDVVELFNLADMIVKVKEPIESEYELFKDGQILFTYLHLAADRRLTEFLLSKKIAAFAYETLSVDHSLPLLEPMSEVAGKMAAMMASVHLGRYHGGSGVLMGGVTGTTSAKVMILGGGIAGKAAAEVAAGLGAQVSILDISAQRLAYLNDVLPANVQTLYSSSQTITSLLPDSDVIIGTVLIPGAKAPKLITKQMLKQMKKGSVLVDVSIDQGGCFESSHATTHLDPTFMIDDVVHYCVANMPGAYPHTSTNALTHATLHYIKGLAKDGVDAVKKLPEMLFALNTYDGKLCNEAVAMAHDMPYKKSGL